jgi:hypothetical protein
MDVIHLKTLPAICMRIFSTSLTNCRHRHSSHKNLSKTRSWGDRIIHMITKFFFTMKHIKIQNGNHGYVKTKNRDKCVKFTSQKFQNLMCAPCCSNYFLANYCRISLLPIFWYKMTFLVIIKHQRFDTILQIQGTMLCVT